MDTSVDDLARHIFSKWPLILAGATICGVVAAAAVTMTPPQFEAQSVLLVSAPKLSDRGSPPDPLAAGTLMSLRALLLSQTTGQAVVSNLPGNGFSVQELVTQVASVDEIRGTPLLRIVVRLPDGALAARVANSLAQRGVELTSRLRQEEAVRSRDYLKAQLDERATRMSEAEARLLEFRRGAQVEILRDDASAMLRQRDELRELLIEIAAERAKLTRAETELAKQDRVLSVRRLPQVSETLFSSAFDELGQLPVDEREKQRPGTRSGLDALNLHDEVLNPVFEVLDYQVATSRSKVAGLEERRNQLAGERRLDSSKFEKLSELYQKETTLARLTDAYELSKRTYLDLVTRYEGSMVDAASQTAQLEIVDRAIAPTRPLPSRRSFIVVLATVAGALASVSLVFFFSFLGPIQRRT